MEPIATLLAPWNSFYVIVGSAAAALTGLQFIAIAIAAEAALGSEATTRAFATPTIVHFSGVLLFATMLSAPWASLTSASFALGGVAFAGFVYTLAVLWHARRQTDYVLVLEDWICHAALPLAGYGTLVGAAIALRSAPASTMFVVGASMLLLLFVGIHNAWDAVTYIALRRRGS